MGGYAVYNKINVHIFISVVGFVSHNESSLHGHELFKKITLL